MPREGDEEMRERRCLVSGESGDSAALVRFVIAPDGAVTPDIAGRLPGRGYWVQASRQAVDEAVRKHLFAKAAARAGKTGAAKTGADGGPLRIVAAEGLAAQVEDLLARSCLNYLGLAKRAGLVVAGFEKVSATLAQDPGAVLVTASDGSADGRSKLARPGRRIVALFNRDELSLALGRENVVHAALTLRGVAVRFIAEAERLAGFRDAG